MDDSSSNEKPQRRSAISATRPHRAVGRSATLPPCGASAPPSEWPGQPMVITNALAGLNLLRRFLCPFNAAATSLPEEASKHRPAARQPPLQPHATQLPAAAHHAASKPRHDDRQMSRSCLRERGFGGRFCIRRSRLRSLRHSRCAGALLGTCSRGTGGKSGRRPGRHLQVEASGPGNAASVQQRLVGRFGGIRRGEIPVRGQAAKSILRSFPQDLDGRYRR